MIPMKQGWGVVALACLLCACSDRRDHRGLAGTGGEESGNEGGVGGDHTTPAGSDRPSMGGEGGSEPRTAGGEGGSSEPRGAGGDCSSDSCTHPCQPLGSHCGPEGVYEHDSCGNETLITRCSSPFNQCGLGADGAARCLGKTCTPGEAFCDGSVAKVCGPLGEYPDTGTDCSPANICVDGQCNNPRCPLGDLSDSWCDNNTIKLCREGGRTTASFQDCGPNQHCHQINHQAYCSPNSPPPIVHDCGASELTFDQPYVEAQVRAAIGLPTGPITNADVSELTELTLTTQYLELGGIECLVALTSLNLQDNQLSDIGPLAKLVNLEWLNLDRAGGFDVSPLASLTRLKTLRLGDVRIQDPTALGSLTQVEDLEINGTSAATMAVVAGLSNLRALEMADTSEWIPDLGNLKALVRLNVSRGDLPFFTPLSGLTGLTELDVSHTTLRDVSSISGLTALKKLDLRYNEVNDITALGLLPELAWLNVSDNPVASLSPLVDSSYIGVGDTVLAEEVCYESYISELAALVDKGVDVMNSSCFH